MKIPGQSQPADLIPFGEYTRSPVPTTFKSRRFLSFSVSLFGIHGSKMEEEEQSRPDIFPALEVITEARFRPSVKAD